MDDRRDEQAPDGKAFEAIARAEAERKKRGMALLAFAIVGSVAMVFAIQAVIGGPGLKLDDVGETEEEILEKTNDPQCRKTIADVQAMEPKFKELVAVLEADLLSQDPAKISAAMLAVKTMSGDFSRLAEDSQEAALRYDDSRAELDQWFTYIQGELRTMERIGEDVLEELEIKRKMEAGEPVEVDLEAAKKKKRTRRHSKEKVDPRTRPPKERLDGAVLAVYDSFQSFRVWQDDTEHPHPCGAADEGEEPWVPAAE